MRVLTDEHIPNAVVRQLRRNYPQTVDVIRAFDAGMTGASYPDLLAWAAEQERIVITGGKATLTDVAYVRLSIQGSGQQRISDQASLPGPSLEICSIADDGKSTKSGLTVGQWRQPRRCSGESKTPVPNVCCRGI